MLRIIGIIALIILGIFLVDCLFIYFVAKVVKGNKLSLIKIIRGKLGI